MNDADLSAGLRTDYEQTPYPEQAYPQLHVARLGALATLFGLTPPTDPQLSILEPGCACGDNLTMMAKDLPQARFLGVDLAQNQITAGQRKLTLAQRERIELQQADLLTYDLQGRQFDYIIAHGLFSWTPDEVKERLLQICRDHLSKHGLACISYNTLPGWSLRQGLGELMTFEARLAGGDHHAIKQSANHLFERFESILGGARQSPHLALFLDEITGMKKKVSNSFSAFVHDDLEQVNDPCYFLQFIEWAHEFDLGYVTDIQLEPTFPGQAPPSIEQAYTQIGNRLLAEQYLDFFTFRRFRSSLLCHKDRQPYARPDPLAFCHLNLRSSLMPKGQAKDGKSDSFRYENRSGHSIETSDPALNTLLLQLFKQGDLYLPFEQTFQLIRTQLPAVHDEIEQRKQIGEFLLMLTGRRLVDVRLPSKTG